MRVGLGSRDVVDHVGAVRLAGVSPSAHFGRLVMAAPPCPLFVSLTNGPKLSVREEGENREILYFLDFE